MSGDEAMNDGTRFNRPGPAGGNGLKSRSAAFGLRSAVDQSKAIARTKTTYDPAFALNPVKKDFPVRCSFSSSRLVQSQSQQAHGSAPFS
jgi:hypothetical protein